jgi:hypothetical protein
VIGAIALALMLQGSAPARAAQVTVRVTPDRPAIGEPITVELRVRVPAGAEVRFPSLPDSLQRLEALDPREVRDASTASFVDRTAIYRLIAFDTGQAAIRLPDVTVRRDGAESRLAVPTSTFRIRSVLPADSTGRIPRPPRAWLSIGSMQWRVWVALAVILALATWAYRAWGQQRRAKRADPDAVTRARTAFAGVQALNLVDAGEPGRHALAHAAVVRDYLAARFPSLDRSRTAEELRTAAVDADLPILPARLEDLFDRANAVAFARAPISSTEATAFGATAVAIVEDLETAWQARQLRHAKASKPKRRGFA